MIAEFEQRLADLLGARLPAPFGGRVAVAPGSAVNGAAVLVGVRRFDRVDEGFGERPQQVPGATDPRRVARLRCQVSLVVRGAADRAATLRGLDDVLYAVDAPDLRDGSALRLTTGDPGFLIDSVMLAGGDVVDEGAVGLSAVGIVAQGWFWPVGTPGQTGTVIGEVRVRGVVLPIELIRERASIAPGDPPVGLIVQVRAAGLLRLGSPPALPFGQLLVQLFSPGNRPGAGALTGGVAAGDGGRLLPLTDGGAACSYEPPATASVDELVVSLDNGSGGAGVELGRFMLVVKAG